MALQFVDATSSKKKTINDAASYSFSAEAVRDFLDGNVRHTTVGSGNEAPFRNLRVLPGLETAR